MGVETLDLSVGSDELTLNLDGWEGPLDLLLNLARGQKVDLAQISILQLVDQYTDYIANARALKLEIAADYLVMAAWLAYLKSCLLLPKDPLAVLEGGDDVTVGGASSELVRDVEAHPDNELESQMRPAAWQAPGCLGDEARHDVSDSNEVLCRWIPHRRIVTKPHVWISRPDRSRVCST